LPRFQLAKYAHPRKIYKFIIFKAFQSIPKWSYAKAIFSRSALAKPAIVISSLATLSTGENQIKIA
jgi:hypothetical protein